MDNLCHTLAGLAIGETGIKRKTPLASITLMIGANLPDVDGFVYFFKPESALGFRRGITHGVLAMAVWPLILAGLMMLVARWMKRPASFREVLLLSSVAIWSHPLLDLTNIYGVRLLSPFSQHWFYGDTLFIVDPWIWITLTLGIIFARRTQSRGFPHPNRWGRVAVGLTLAYIAVMAAMGARGRTIVRRAFEGSEDIRRVMISPVPLDPRRREFVVETARGYISGELDWRRGVHDDERWARGDSTLMLQLYGGDPRLVNFRRWTRFPFWVTGPNEGCPRGFLCAKDLRYHPAQWATVALPAPRGLSSGSSPSSRERP